MYSGKSGTPAGGRKGTAQFPAIKVELFASNRSNQTEKNKYASQESAELLKELTTSPQVVASQMGSNREGIHAIPEDKREHRASAVHSEADDDGRWQEDSQRRGTSGKTGGRREKKRGDRYKGKAEPILSWYKPCLL